MTSRASQMMREVAARGKYAPLFRHLTGLDRSEWHVSFDEVEAVLGFRLPPSARIYRPWWSNSKLAGGHSHAFAWLAAGWKTRSVDLEKENLVFSRQESNSGKHIRGDDRRKFSLDRILPCHDPGPWPRDFRSSRSEIYDADDR